VSIQEPEHDPAPQPPHRQTSAEDVLRCWRAAAAGWRRRVSVAPAIGHQPTRVFVDLSHLPGVAVTSFHSIQTNPPLAHALFALDNNTEATQAFMRVAVALAEETDLLAAHLEVAGIDSRTAHLLVAALRGRPVLVDPEHVSLFEDVEILCRRLEAKLRGLSQIDADLNLSARAVEAAASQPPVSPGGFYDLALATLDDAKSLITFRRARAAHPEWEQLSRTIPAHLVAVLDEWHDAARDASLAQHEHEEALGGAFYNEWIEPSRRDREGTVRALTERAECERVRLEHAVKAVNETRHDRAVAENALAEEWLRTRGAAFRRRYAAYTDALTPHVQALEAQRTGAYVLRSWKDTCACTVLRQIGEVLHQVEDERERKDDWWGTYCLAERFDDLTDDAWRDLRIDVRQEAAKVREFPEAGMSGSAAPPIFFPDQYPLPNGDATSKDALVRWHAVRPTWGRPRSPDGGRPVEMNLRSRQSIEDATQMAAILEELLQEARAVNPAHSMTLLEMIRHLRGGVFITTNGVDETIDLLRRVDLIIADLESSRHARAESPQSPATAGGQWVPATLLVKKDDPRIDKPGKVTAFCDKHGIPRRPGRTKDGKPWPQRSDVNLEAWKEKLAALAREDQRLQDAADARTADRAQFDKWAEADTRDSK
jgi:hypothetical protein